MHDGEERKKLSLYLHPEDSADRLALAEIETVPRKNRGELYRQALITGLIMHQLDAANSRSVNRIIHQRTEWWMRSLVRFLR
ncbi:mediator of plasmid stability [Klebsiella pneumoniae]|nr:mediator of plasmid stability [Klebsiella pneumoniae]